MLQEIADSKRNIDKNIALNLGYPCDSWWSRNGRTVDYLYSINSVDREDMDPGIFLRCEFAMPGEYFACYSVILLYNTRDESKELGESSSESGIHKTKSTPMGLIL